jgi:hypothetical protein
MFVSYQFTSITQEHISTRAKAHIHLGDVTTEDEPDIDNVMQPITRYRVQEVIEDVSLNFPEGATQDELDTTMRERLKTARADTLPIEEQRDA